MIVAVEVKTGKGVFVLFARLTETADGVIEGVSVPLSLVKRENSPCLVGRGVSVILAVGSMVLVGVAVGVAVFVNVGVAETT